MNRTTLLIGAGSPLDLYLPNGVAFPSTGNITQKVCEPYRNFMDEKRPIKIVQDICDRLMAVYPPKENPFSCEAPQPYIHFEHLFHVLEMLDSYHWVWRGNCKNEALRLCGWCRENNYEKTLALKCYVEGFRLSDKLSEELVKNSSYPLLFIKPAELFDTLQTGQ